MSSASSTSLDTLHVSSALNEKPSHGIGRGAEEMSPAVPMLRPLDIHQPQVHLVDQGRCLEGLARPLLSHLVSRKFTQRIIDQRHQLFGGLGLALFNREK